MGFHVALRRDKIYPSILSKMRKREEYRRTMPTTIPELKLQTQGLDARFSLVLTKKNDNTRVARVAVERLYRHAESILPSARLSLKGEVDTWVNPAASSQCCCDCVRKRGATRAH